MKRIYAAIILFVSLICTSSGYSANIEDAGEYLKKNVIRKRLKNGITLLMLNRGFSPTLAFETAFRVGSADESYRTAGAAHLLEHMLFKGTDRLGTKDYLKEKVLLKEIEAVGETLDRLKTEDPDNSLIPQLEKKLKKLQARERKYIITSPYDKIYTAEGGVGFNASTSRDKTGYYIRLPSSKLELWAKLESERLRNPVLREYYLERSNVLEERLMRYGSSGEGRIFERFLAYSFIAHPYRHPIIGWKSNIPLLSIKDVREFYYRYYIPSRMTITIVGKQDTDHTYGIIRKYFEDIESRPDPGEIPVKEPPMNGEIRFKYYYESNPYLIIGWHKPTFPSKDDYIFDIVSEVLAGGKSSRLYRSLVIEKKMVASVSSWNGSPGARYNNLFIIYAVPKRSYNPEKIEKEIYRELKKLSLNISDHEIKKAVNKLESEIVFGLDSNRGLARLLSYYQTIFGNWEYAADYIKVLKSIGRDDIKKAIGKYLNDRNRIVGILYDSRKKK